MPSSGVSFDALRMVGVRQPNRVVRLMREAIAANGLDLTGLTVFTEVGTGGYLTTPFVAAMAGAAQVHAVSRDSSYGPFASVRAAAEALARLTGTDGRVQLVRFKTPETVGQADIVTNLGFVRPIDRETVAMMKEAAVVPLMCEAWEFRDGDIDLDACSRSGIAVLATNEDAPGVEVFDFSGPLALKLLFEAGLEVYKSRIVVVSTDKFGAVITRCLRANGADVSTIARLDELPAAMLAGADALLVADYCSRDLFIGPGGQMEAGRLARLAPDVVVVAFAGHVDAEALSREDIACFPPSGGVPFRMARTFAHLGVKPVIDLHAAGLKVAEVVLRIPAASRSAEAVSAALGARGSCLLVSDSASSAVGT